MRLCLFVYTVRAQTVRSDSEPVAARVKHATEDWPRLPRAAKEMMFDVRNI